MWQFSDDVLGLRLSRFLSYDCVQDRPKTVTMSGYILYVMRPLHRLPLVSLGHNVNDLSIINNPGL